MSILETPRLLLRECSLQDAAQLSPILSDPEVRKYSLKGALDEEGIALYVKEILEHYKEYGHGLWCVTLKETGEIIGLAGLLHQVIYDKSYTELAYRFARKHWGHMYATEAASAIKNYAFETLGISHLISLIDVSNTRSIKLARRLGMIKAWHIKLHGFEIDVYDTHKITLQPYDAHWKEMYQKEKATLEAVFASHPITFYHIGSTSIPGCAAKPIIDILGVTNDVVQIDAFNESLEKSGFIALGEYGMKQRRFFRKRLETFAHLHIFEDSDPEVSRHIHFREYLISHPAEIKKYSALKHKLAEKKATDWPAYTWGKSKYVKEIDCKAVLHSDETYWNQKNLPRKSSWTEEEIVNAIESNMHLQITYFVKYMPLLQIGAEPDATVITSSLKDDLFNFVVSAEFTPKNIDTRIERICTLFKRESSPFAWWVFDQDILLSHLDRSHCAAKKKYIGMSLNVQNKTFPKKNKELSIKRILSQKEISDFTSVVVESSTYPDEFVQFFSLVPPRLYSEGAPFEVYIGTIHSTPVVTGSLILHANVGGIYFITTHPEYRGRGFAKDMMNFLLSRIQEKGYHVAILQATENAVSLYEKLGFKSHLPLFEYKYT